MTDENEKSRLNWARREAREGAIDRLYKQAYTCLFDESGRKAWDSMSVDEQARFLQTKKLPSDFEFSHLWSAAHYPDIAHDPSTGYLTSYLDHRYGDHGGDTSIPLNGSPRDPNWRDSWGTQEIDASTSAGQKDLGMSVEQTYQARLAAELKKDYPEFFKANSSSSPSSWSTSDPSPSPSSSSWSTPTVGRATYDSHVVESAIQSYGVFPGSSVET